MATNTFSLVKHKSLEATNKKSILKIKDNIHNNSYELFTVAAMLNTKQ